MSELIIAVVGGIVVLVVQGFWVVVRNTWTQHARGEKSTSRPFRAIRNGIAKCSLLLRRRRILEHASKSQAALLAEHFANDPFWALQQVEFGPRADQVSSGDDAAALPFASVLDNDRLVLVVGESGSGKSSALASHCIGSTDRPNIFVRAGDFTANQSLEALIGGALPHEKQVKACLTAGLIGVFFDGFELLEAEDRDAFLIQLDRFVRRYRDVTIVLTARPNSELRQPLISFRQVHPQPLSPESVLRTIEGSLSPAEGTRLKADLTPELQGLCSSPLALRMLLQTYRSEGSLPENICELYADFLDLLMESTTDTQMREVKLRIVGSLAHGWVGGTIGRTQKEVLGAISLSIQDLRVATYLRPVPPEEVLKQLRAENVLRGSKSLTFAHDGLQDYLAATELCRQLRDDELSIQDISGMVGRDARWRNAVVRLSGLLADSTDLVRAVKSKDLLLAAQCVEAAVVVESDLVDLCIIDGLYEFKFGTAAFNYPVVFALRQVADRRSPRLPERVVGEMSFWLGKYEFGDLRELSDATERELLQRVVDANTGDRLVADSMWTLAVRGVHAASPLIRAHLEDPTSRYRVQAALALGKLGDVDSLQLLRRLALDRQEMAALRYVAFNSLGQLAQSSVIPDLVAYIQDDGPELEGDARENAAWALLEILRQNGGPDDEIQRVIVENTARGTRYARAMFIYIIGQFKLKTGFDCLCELAETESDQFLLEESAVALGEFGAPSPQEALERLLERGDVIVRARAIESLGRTVPTLELDELHVALDGNESQEVLRDAVRKATQLREISWESR